MLGVSEYARHDAGADPKLTICVLCLSAALALDVVGAFERNEIQKHFKTEYARHDAGADPKPS